MLLFLGLFLFASHAHICTRQDLQSLPVNLLREKCSPQTSSILSPSSSLLAKKADQCMYAFNQAGCVFKLSNLGPGVANVTASTLGCTPLSHAFTWASSISPANGVAYVMGGQGSTSRNLFTVNMTTGQVIYQPTVGASDNTPYFLAADQRPGSGRLYGAWSLPNAGYRLAEIDPKAGQVKQYLASETWSPVPGQTDCTPYCGFSVNCGYFSIPDNSYVTSWWCITQNVNVVVRVNVDTLKISLAKYLGSPDYFIVNPVTGLAYISETAYSVSRINESSGSLTTVITIPNQNVVLYDLVVTATGVCFGRGQDTNFGRSHPQAEDFVCFNEGIAEGQESTQLYSIPYLDQFQMPFATQSIMGSC